MILDLVRHGDTGRRGYLDGRTDPPLVPEALDAVAARHVDIPWTRIVSSPLQRARGTAAALVGRELASREIDPRWAELDFGDWDGRAARDVPVEALDAFHRDPYTGSPPGGESWSDFTDRVRGAVADLLAADDPGPVLVVSHGGPMRMVLTEICGLGLAASWAVRLGYGTRLRVWVEQSADRPSGGGLWGEIVELAQP